MATTRTANAHWEGPLLSGQGTVSLDSSKVGTFDVTWAYGGTWSKTHQMTARGKDDDFTREDLLAVGRAFDVPKDGAEILEEVESALGLWEPEARAAGLAPEWINRVEALFRHFA